MVCNEFDECVWDVDTLVIGLAIENSDARFQFGLLEIGDESSLKPREQPVSHTGHFLRSTVCRKNDLFAGLMQDVEDVEEAFLRFLLIAEELDVIDD